MYIKELTEYDGRTTSNTQPRKMWQQWERLILIEEYSHISQGLDWVIQQGIVSYNVARPYGKASYRLLNKGPGLHGPMTRIGKHYNDVIMSAVASQITGASIIWSIVGPGADQNNLQSSASLAFVRGIHRWPVNSPHNRPVTRKMFPFDDVTMWHVIVASPERSIYIPWQKAVLSIRVHGLAERGSGG